MAEEQNPSTLLFNATQVAFTKGRFAPLVLGLGEALCAAGAQVDRIHVPISSLNGFKHPRYATILVLWERGEEVEEEFVEHEAVTDEEGAIDLKTLLVGSPFWDLFFEGKKCNSFDLSQGKLTLPVLQELAGKGYTDYLAFGLDLPDGSRQVLGFASHAKGGFGASLEQILLELEPTISLSFFAIYQAAISLSISRTYIGPRTAKRVLSGEIRRGKHRTLEAGILFCDVRRFTQMSEELGTERLVGVMNKLFEGVGEVLQGSRGEILKFMGDAMLVVFPREAFETDAEVARQMVKSAMQADTRVKELGQLLDLDLKMGFGVHLGTVIYGNIGTQERLDFTVLGRAVNLAARLESLTKKLGVSLAASTAVAQHVPQLHPFGPQKLKGIGEDILVWCDLAKED